MDVLQKHPCGMIGSEVSKLLLTGHGLAVSQMIMTYNGKPLRYQIVCKIIITIDILNHAVDQLNDSLRLFGLVSPEYCVDLCFTICRRKCKMLLTCCILDMLGLDANEINMCFNKSNMFPKTPSTFVNS